MPTPVAPVPLINERPSDDKLKLIRKFLELIGVQDLLDTGSFLDRYAMPDQPMWPVTQNVTLLESVAGIKVRSDALKASYLRRKAAYQKAYEDQVDNEFSQSELHEIVTFLSKPVGKHYLDGRWRVEAYAATNLEDMEGQIVKEAVSRLDK